jgi:hypothetical protein
MLLALEKKLLAGVSKTVDYGNLPIGSLTLMELYPQPRYGVVDGIDVRIEGEGNRIGFSPVTKCVELGEHGETAWIPTELVKNIRLEPFGLMGTTRGKTARPARNETK